MKKAITLTLLGLAAFGFLTFLAFFKPESDDFGPEYLGIG